MQPRNVVGRTNTQMKQMIEVQNIIVLCMLAQSFKICHNVYMPCVIAQMYLPNTSEHQGFRTRITCSRHGGGYFCHANVKKYLSYCQTTYRPDLSPHPSDFPSRTSDLRFRASDFIIWDLFQTSYFRPWTSDFSQLLDLSPQPTPPSNCGSRRNTLFSQWSRTSELSPWTSIFAKSVLVPPLSDCPHM